MIDCCDVGSVGAEAGVERAQRQATMWVKRDLPALDCQGIELLI